MKNKILILSFLILNSCNFASKSERQSDEKLYERQGEEDIVSLNEYFATDEASQLSRKGVDLGLEGKYEIAEKMFLKALKIEPKNPIILNNIGLTYFERGEYNKAIKYYNKSLTASDSTSLLAATNLGLTYYHQMDYARALKILNYTLENSQTDKTRQFVVRLHRLMVNIELEDCKEIKQDREAIEKLRYNNQVGDYKTKISQFDKRISKLCTTTVIANSRHR
jgi:tetratricopeptide (TPR) repeat protein